MIFKRKIYSKLLEWKEKSKGSRALLVEGARRIGKSTIVEEFAKNEYKTYILINFNECDEVVKNAFKTKIRKLDEFFSIISVEYGVTLYNRESIIIFDEVQMFPKAREAIKSLVKDGRFDYIETGSLISIQENVKDITIPSEESSIKMYPLDQVCESLIVSNFEKGTNGYNFAYQQFFENLEATVEELTKCFLLEFGENRNLSYGRCNQEKSFNELYNNLKTIE